MRDRTALALLGGQVLSMLGFASYSALLPLLRDLWGLTHAQAGLIASGFFLGYIGTVSFWSTLTDRIDARRIYALGCLFAAAGLLGMGLVAGGFASALGCQMLYGVGISATYMPGLKILSERSEGAAQTRRVAFYTAFFGLGNALSLALTQPFAAPGRWPLAFIIGGIGPLVSLGLVLRGTAPLARSGRPCPVAPIGVSDVFPLRAWIALLRSGQTRYYTLGYAVHCCELFGSRAWIVAFLAFCSVQAAREGRAGLPLDAAGIAASVSLCSVFASILGNEAALRIGRVRWIRLAMAGSAGLGAVLGLAAGQAMPLVALLALAYSLLVMADSATLTAGVVRSAPPEQRGVLLGLYSLAGFGGGMVGPAAFGLALDAFGTAQGPLAWSAGFALIGAGGLLLALTGWAAPAPGPAEPRAAGPG